MRPSRVSSSGGKKGFASTLRSFLGRRSGRLVISALVVLVGLFFATGLFSIFGASGFSITIDKQSGPQLSARANQTVSRWRTIGPLSNASCSASTFNVPPSQRGSIGTSSRVSLNENTDDGKYYCFEATASDDDKAYKSSGILNFDSRVASRFVQTDTSLHSIPNLLAPITIRTIGPLSNASCSASTFNVPPSQRSSIGTSNQITLDSSDNGKYYCYELTDEWRRKTYKISPLIRIQNLPPPPVDTTPPTITTRRSGNYLIAVANETGASWRSFGPQTTTSCSASTFNVPPSERGKIGTSARVTLDTADNGKYYCYEATDDAGNKGYKISSRISVETTTLPPPLPTDTTPPKITVRQSGNALSATANETGASWRSFGPQTTTSCSTSTFNVPPSQRSSIGTSARITLDSSDNGKYYCYEATDNANNKGYKISGRITLDTVPPPPPPEPTDTTPPRVTVQQSGNVLTATANETVQSWRSIGPQTTTSCSASTFNLPVPTPTSLLNKIGSSARITLDSSDSGKYYCFKATDNAGNEGYKISLKLITSSPLQIISIKEETKSQSEPRPHTLVATANQPADWRVVEFGVGSTNSCNVSRFVNAPDYEITRYKNKSVADFTLLSPDWSEPQPSSGRFYYCFEASSLSGKVYKRSPLITYTPPTEVSIVSIVQKGRILEVVANERVTWYYARGDCDSNSDLGGSDWWNNPSFKSLSGRVKANIALTDTNHLRRLCVVAVRDGISFDDKQSEILYTKASPIKIRFLNNGARVEAYTDESGPKGAYTWQWVGPSVSSACNKNVIANADSGKSRSSSGEKSVVVSLDADDHNKYYCFQLVNPGGYKYWKASSKINRDVDTPAVDVARKGKTILQATASEHVTWRRSSPLTSSTCSASVLSSNSSRDNYVSLKDSDHGKYYCFEATDRNGNKTYAASSKIDVRGPKLNISFVPSGSGGKSLEVSADENFYLSNKSPVDSTARCTASLIPLRGNPAYRTRYAITLNQSHFNKYVCIAAYDSSGNSTYQATRVIVAGDLPVSENQINENAQGTGDTDTSPVVVSRTTTPLSGYQEALVNDLDLGGHLFGSSDYWVEKVTSHLDEYFRLYTQQQSQDRLNIRVTLPPKLEIGKDYYNHQRYFLGQFYYMLVDEQADCSLDLFLDSSNLAIRQASRHGDENISSDAQKVDYESDTNFASLSLSRSDAGKYYCFRVELRADIRQLVPDRSMERVFVTRQPIIIDEAIQDEPSTFVRAVRNADDQTIKVEVNPELEENIDEESWEYVQLSSEDESCDAEDFDGNQQQGNTIPDDEDNYCLRVADEWGVYYYISEVDLEDFEALTQSPLLTKVITIAGIVTGAAVVLTVVVMMVSMRRQKKSSFKF